MTADLEVNWLSWPSLPSSLHLVVERERKIDVGGKMILPPPLPHPIHCLWFDGIPGSLERNANSAWVEERELFLFSPFFFWFCFISVFLKVSQDYLLIPRLPGALNLYPIDCLFTRS